jgi:hypothetical protein
MLSYGIFAAMRIDEVGECIGQRPRSAAQIALCADEKLSGAAKNITNIGGFGRYR